MMLLVWGLPVFAVITLILGSAMFAIMNWLNH